MSPDTTTATVFTIGHSNHPLEAFVALLRRHRVSAVADVRSAPYSRFNPHFSRGALAAALKERGIEYVYLGRELGGRPDDTACYEKGRVRYDRVARTGRFREGVGRVVQGAGRHRIALMCAEREPLDCHRTLLVARALDERGVQVVHIHGDGTLEGHGAAVDRLLAKLDPQPDGDLFRRQQTRAALIDEAVALQTQRVGFVGDGGGIDTERTP